jgi:putative (di)nucleoside polyphosphate hydrolase
MLGLFKKYRPNVAIIVTDGKGNILLCERSESRFEGQRQTVQGGIDRGETPREAACRELGEEIGLKRDQFEITAFSEKKFRYEWPEEYRKIFNFGSYVGQEQQYFLATVSPNVVFRLNTYKHPEFSRVYWGKPQELLDSAWEAKKPGIKNALEEFGLLKPTAKAGKSRKGSRAALKSA